MMSFLRFLVALSTVCCGRLSTLGAQQPPFPITGTVALRIDQGTVLREPSQFCVDSSGPIGLATDSIRYFTSPFCSNTPAVLIIAPSISGLAIRGSRVYDVVQITHLAVRTACDRDARLRGRTFLFRREGDCLRSIPKGYLVP